jgi:hypothetical protein
MKLPVRVEVVWHDAAYKDSEFWIDKPPTGPVGDILHTLGWLLRDDESGVVIGRDITDEGNGRHTVEIPRAYVKEMVTLARPRVRRPRAPEAPIPVEGQ